MLTKRANILFDEELWDTLSKLAYIRKTSVSSLIRTVVRDWYIEEEELEQRRKAIEATLKHRPKPVKGRIDYKALINAGRKF